MGGLLGFLRFNTFPARVFMGDAGSQFLGFTAGALSVLLTKGSATPVSVALPLLILGFPLLDTLSVMALRIRAGRSPFSADRSHFHHRLLSLGFDHHEAVIVIYAVQCLLLLLAWQFRFETDLLIVTTFFVFAFLFTAVFSRLERSGWRWRSSGETRRSLITRLREWFIAKQRLPRWSLITAFACAVVYLLGVGICAYPPSADLGVLGAVGVLVLALGCLFMRGRAPDSWLAKGALYVGVIMAVYLDQLTAGNSVALQAENWIVLPVLALAVAIATRLTGNRRFEATPLDLLVIFAAICLPSLPGLSGAAHNYGSGAVKLVLLCYAVELILALGMRLRTALIGAVGAFYLLAVVRAFGTSFK
jgi:UDP-GlcNAc:undecaprenyl-phosphate GlcNAc-1-phosphate transferase